MSATTQRFALAALAESEPERKIAAVEELSRSIDLNGVVGPWSTLGRLKNPGRPERPVLVAPHAVPRRRLGSLAGRVALIHAVAHIEFNAINLALDAIARFAGMPAAYYLDWAGVASDEARHFHLLSNRLRELDAEYGELPAHNGLWEMAVATEHDVLVRMALVPRVLEARGLDVTPGMIDRLQVTGDLRTVEILKTILQEEESHVAIGSRWFEYLCAQRDLNPAEHFALLLREYFNGRVRGPFNYDARRRAGFSAQEMRALEELA